MPIKLKRNRISSSLGRISVRLQTLPKKGFEFWRKTTPKDTGNARRRTKLNKNTIEARYPYAQRLDEGWSKQAPRGMLQPTLEYLGRIAKRMVRK